MSDFLEVGCICIVVKSTVPENLGKTVRLVKYIGDNKNYTDPLSKFRAKHSRNIWEIDTKLKYGLYYLDAHTPHNFTYGISVPGENLRRIDNYDSSQEAHTEEKGVDEHVSI